MKTLSRDEARRVYDRIGRRQDWQAFYEDPATDLLVEEGQFSGARAVFEFGCGTGRLAERLLCEKLPAGATYLGVDLSSTMIGLAKERLARFAPRAQATLSDGGPPVGQPAESFDRFLSTYVLDLLSEEEIGAVLREARRILEPGGLLCLASLSTGSGVASRALIQVWSALHRLSPSLVGGCRPIEIPGYLSSSEWKIQHHARLAPFAVPTEVVVAERV